MVRSRGLVAGLLIASCIAAAPAYAEVTVSITISGTVEELVPILQKLQELGLGGASPTADPLKLNVHSVMTGADAAAAPAPADAAPTQPAIESVAVEPAVAKLGDAVLITAKVADPTRVVDTVAASVASVKVDLFDNGTEGDVTAGDGIWSRKAVLPATLAPGEAPIAVSAYNANGEAVQAPGPDGQPAPLSAQTKLIVAP